MLEKVLDIAPKTLSQFDAVIDARSPSEFAEDHLPNAINLPVLDDAQRAEVGTIYKQVSRFDARRLGAAYVARNVARHLETALAEKDKTFRPLIYCWRGGMRSNAMATILSQVGWRAGVLEGGYKTWRQAVVENLRSLEAPLPLILIDGQTGTAKTDILNALPNHGAQMLDLEDLARHRGSVFGRYEHRTQPSQKLFESQLFERLRRFDLSQPVFVEAESNRIGRCEVPKRLWNAMRAAPRITITATRDQRTAYLLNAYMDMTRDKSAICEAVNRLRPFHPASEIEAWLEFILKDDFASLASALISAHYDPLYDRSRRNSVRTDLMTVTLKEIDETAIQDAAAQIARAELR